MALKKINFNGWHADRPDHRDYDALTMLSLVAEAPTPISYDMRPHMPPVYDQKTLGSCVLNALAAAVQFTEKEVVAYDKRPVPSRLLLYYFARLLQGTLRFDSGSTIRMGMKVLAKYGYCAEQLWPYVIKNFMRKPPRYAIMEAKHHKLKSIMYGRVKQDLSHLKAVLAANNPIAFGFTVYDSFMRTGRDGVVAMPTKTENVLGGHAVLIVGYDDAKEVFIVRNSWGKDWGDGGYCYFPYEFILNPDLCSDFWTLMAVPNFQQSLAA